MLSKMDEQFEIWWDRYKSPYPEDVTVMNFQDAFRAGYEAGQRGVAPLYQEKLATKAQGERQ